MGGAKRTILEMGLLTVAATGVALATNGLRSSGAIDFARNYFDKGDDRVAAARAAATKGGETAPKPSPTAAAPATTVAPAPTEPPARVAEAASAESGSDSSDPSAVEHHLEHGFQEIRVEEVKALHDDPNTAMGVNLFVDARGDAAYADGRIPGAIQLDHYKLEKHLQDVLYRAQAAEKIIVYCNGGDCEDSIFACTDLLDAGIPYESIYLYAGGWKEWSGKAFPIERSDAAEGND